MSAQVLARGWTFSAQFRTIGLASTTQGPPSTADLASALAVDEARLVAVLNGATVIDADLDLRLSRYFQMSEGFFLGLQIDHDLLEAKRAMNGELERIMPRAA